MKKGLPFEALLCRAKEGFALPLILTAIAVVAVIIGGLIIYVRTHPLTEPFGGKYFNRSVKNEKPSTPVSQDETADWKAYRNEEYGFEIKYPVESGPSEHVGTEESGQFTYLLLIKFGTVPLKSQHGYSLEVNKQKSLDDYRLELIGHTTDKIESEEKTIINGNSWVKLNYKIFLTTDYVSITTAFINHGGHGYAITSSSLDINQILSTFQFID